MTYPFAAGATLTAADLNAYAGLVFVKSTNIGASTSIVTVTDAFSSSFANYRIVISTWTSTNSAVTLKLSGATGLSDYDSKILYFATYTTGAWTDVMNAADPIWYLGYSTSAVSTPQNGLIVDLFGPNTNGRHRFVSTFASYVAGMAAGQTASTSGNASTGFSILPAVGTFGGGKIDVYGYNNE